MNSMNRSGHLLARWAATLLAAALGSAEASAQAQSDTLRPVVVATAADPHARIRDVASTGLVVHTVLPGSRARVQTPLDLREFGQYVGWGMTIGAAVGLAYGLATERRPTRGLDVLGDTVLGGTIGMAAGALIYVARTAFGRAR